MNLNGAKLSLDQVRQIREAAAAIDCVIPSQWKARLVMAKLATLPPVTVECVAMVIRGRTFKGV